MDKKEFIKSIYLTEGPNPRARIWRYRMDSEPLVKKLIKFDIPYAEIEVRRYLKANGVPYKITLWPVFAPEPPIIRKELPAVDF